MTRFNPFRLHVNFLIYPSPLYVLAQHLPVIRCQSLINSVFASGKCLLLAPRLILMCALSILALVFLCSFPAPKQHFTLADNSP